MSTSTESKTSFGQARVAVLGAGSVGSYFGGMLARAGAQVTLIARAPHVEAIRRSGLLLDTTTFQERVKVEASSEVSAVRGADLVLFCVKTIDTEDAARLLAPHLTPSAIVVSLQNGVDNVTRICSATGIDALPAVVYIAAALPEPGHMKHSGRGDLTVGELPNISRAAASPPRTERVAALFTAAGVPCRVSPTIEIDLWTKMLMNCAGNALSGIAQTSFGHVAQSLPVRTVLQKVIEETVSVARASGVPLPDQDWAEKGRKNSENLGEATSSMAQDIARGKRTEIDSLNGYIVRRGAELGIETPVSLTLTSLVKLIEETNAKRGRTAGTSR